MSQWDGQGAPPAWYFKTRRRMAVVALVSIIVIQVWLMYFASLERIAALSDTIMWFYTAMCTVIGTYMGTTTWATVFQRSK